MAGDVEQMIVTSTPAWASATQVESVCTSRARWPVHSSEYK
jgi:hypothetical protein